MRTYFSILLYLSTAAGANLVLASCGQWMMPVLALIFIGLDMTLRDSLHARWEGKNLWLRMLLLILGGSLLSYCINPSSQRICFASAIVFILSGIVDTFVYSILTKRSFFVKANVSNLFSSLVDTSTFALLAFSQIEWAPCSLSYLAKVTGALLFSYTMILCSCRGDNHARSRSEEKVQTVCE